MKKNILLSGLLIFSVHCVVGVDGQGSSSDQKKRVNALLLNSFGSSHQLYSQGSVLPQQVLQFQQQYSHQQQGAMHCSIANQPAQMSQLDLGLFRPIVQQQMSVDSQPEQPSQKQIVIKQKAVKIHRNMKNPKQNVKIVQQQTVKSSQLQPSKKLHVPTLKEYPGLFPPKNYEKLLTDQDKADVEQAFALLVDSSYISQKERAEMIKSFSFAIDALDSKRVKKRK